MTWLLEWERISLFCSWNAKFLGLVVGMKPEGGKMRHLLHCLVCKPVSRSGCWVAPTAFFNLWASSKPSVSFAFVHHMHPVSWTPLGARRLCLFPPQWFEGAPSTKRRRGNFNGPKAKLLLATVVMKGGNHLSRLLTSKSYLSSHPCPVVSAKRGALWGTISFLGMVQIVLRDAGRFLWRLVGA